MSDWHAASALLLYFVAFALGLGVMGARGLLSGEWLRKLYHLASSLAILVLVLAFARWESAVAAISVLMLVGYALILLGSRIPFAAKAIDRGSGIGEIREHLLMLLLAMLVLLWVFWGALGEHARFAAVAGMITWGIGDAAASLAGMRYARRRYQGRLFDSSKSPVGTLAMVLISAPLIVLVLLLMTPLSLLQALIPAAVAAVAGGFAEAATRNGRDTLSVPLVSAGAVYPAVIFLGPVLGGTQ